MSCVNGRPLDFTNPDAHRAKALAAMKRDFLGIISHGSKMLEKHLNHDYQCMCPRHQEKYKQDAFINF